MGNQVIEEKQRISKSTGRLMILVGVFFDLLPLILIAVATGLVVYGLSSSIGEDIVDSVGGNVIDDSWNKLQVAVKSLGAGAGAIAVAFFGGPILYTVGSFLSVCIGYALFTIWFLFKGVNIWSFNKVQRVLVNGLALLVESTPILNLLPGITIMVWRHVKISQMEDQLLHNEKVEKIGKQLERISKATAH